MEPSSEFWTEAARNSPSGLVIILVAVVAVLFVIVRWGMPLVKELREKRLEIERYRIEVDEKAAAALDERERERIKTTQRQISAQEESTRVIEALSVEVAATNSNLLDSKVNSRDMGRTVIKTNSVVTAVAEQVGEIQGQVNEIHAIVVHKDSK